MVGESDFAPCQDKSTIRKRDIYALSLKDRENEMIETVYDSKDGMNASEFLEYCNFMRYGGKSDRVWNLVNDTYERLERRGVVKKKIIEKRGNVYFINKK